MQSEAAHARAAARELNRIMSKPLSREPRERVVRLIGKREVKRMLGYKSDDTIGYRVAAGLIPAPLKGLSPRPGQDPAKWKREPCKWQSSIITALAAGLFDDQLPMTQREWQELIDEHNEGIAL